MRFADLDAVTVDAHGTLLEVRDPVPALRGALAERGVERDAGDVRRAFEAEAAFYMARTSTAYDAPSLQRLRVDCTRVFLAACAAELDPDAFVEPYVDSLVFDPIDGAVEALRSWRARGLAVAVVSNWDVSLSDALRRLGLDALVDAVVTSADVRADKPDPAVFRAALRRLGVAPDRALHVGDRAADAQGARAAGMHFAWAPLAGALAALEA
jgi:putative hydrolase of the HAD superfamily